MKRIFTVTTTNPKGVVRVRTTDSIKDAGRLVAFSLYDNTDATKKEATQMAMRAERTGNVEYGGYTYTIERGDA